VTRCIGAQIALLGFALALAAGLYAGNTPVTILTRAIVSMFVCLAVGRGAAWAAKLVLQDFWRRRKSEIDRRSAEEFARAEAAAAAAAPGEAG
jgi:uncharacterized membrane protein